MVHKMLTSPRELRVSELLASSSYLGTGLPCLNISISNQPSLTCNGKISLAWYEENMTTEKSVTPVHGSRYAVADQGWWEMDASAPSIGLLPGSVVVTVPFKAYRKKLEPGDIIVVQRDKAGLTSHTIARVGPNGQLVPIIDGGRDVDGTPIALAIEVRQRIG
jgi:hypothetical protein